MTKSMREIVGNDLITGAYHKHTQAERQVEHESVRALWKSKTSDFIVSDVELAFTTNEYNGSAYLSMSYLQKHDRFLFWK